MDIAQMLQEAMVTWLYEVEEAKAATWFAENWTGEFGNYTNASAGHVGSNDAQHIESHWRYMKRDTRYMKRDTAGSNMKMLLRTFVPSLTTYLRDYSQRHVGDIQDANGLLRFSSFPKIDSAMWKEVQDIDTRRLIPAYVEGSAAARMQWRREMLQVSAMGDVNTNASSVSDG
jgi:hypothetical protein